jgi:hypothetical protein
MMEAASTSETSVNFYQTTRRYNPEDSHLHARRSENHKSYLLSFLQIQSMKDKIKQMPCFSEVLTWSGRTVNSQRDICRARRKDMVPQ